MSDSEQSGHGETAHRHGNGSAPVRLRNYPSWIRWFCIVTCVAAGAFCGMVFKWQNLKDVHTCAQCEPSKFSGVVYQTFMMFVGEALCLFVYLIDHKLSASENKALFFDFAHTAKYYETPVLPAWPFLFFSVLDFGATFMVTAALKFTYASTVQMLRNSTIIITALLQPSILRKAVTRHELFGIVIITGALVLAAIPAAINPDPNANDSASQAGLGIVLALAGTATHAIHMTLEELFMRKGRSSAMRSIGYEGVGGIFFTLLAWPVMQKTGFEDITGSWYAAAHSSFVIITTLIYIPCSTIFNAFGYAIAMLGSTLLRSVCYAIKSPLVWVISLIVKWQTYEHWSLASALTFGLGFAIYVNLMGFPYGHPVHKWFAAPIPCCCTDARWDTPYEQEPSLVCPDELVEVAKAHAERLV